MSIEKSKTSEIKRLTTPLTIKDSKAYDDDGNLLKCVETISDVRFINEPKSGILSEDEILKYASESKSASLIRLKRGFGSISDVMLVNESLPWIFSFYYVVLICVSIVIVFGGNKLLMFLLLLFYVLPLVYLYFKFNVNRYHKREIKKQEKISKQQTVEDKTPKAHVKLEGVESLKVYEKEIDHLKVVFDVKEGVVRDLIKKRFEPPQITYDKFISVVDSSHKIFYNQSEAATNIINLAVDDTPRVKNEIESKIEAMKAIINQIEELTNELVININDDETTDEVRNLLDDMENIIESVKEY